MSLCRRCVSGTSTVPFASPQLFVGVLHEGTPEGKWENIGGVECYVATPDTEFSNDKVLIFLTDIFGPQLNNARLLADDFARNGFKTIIPDMFEGEGPDEDALYSGKVDVVAWFQKHSPQAARPFVDKVVAALKESGVTSFATTGYCYGGRIAFDLALDGVTSVTVVAHPSLLKVPEDLGKYKQTKAPLLINSCTIDDLFPVDAQAKADEILGGGKFAPGYERQHWDGCTHGFAIRGALDDPKVRAAKEGAFKASVDFLMKHF